MKLPFLFLLLLLIPYLVIAFKPKSPQKTKRYKCIEVEDDEDVQGQTTEQIEEEDPGLRKIGGFQAALPRPPIEELVEDVEELPSARRFVPVPPPTTQIPTTRPPPPPSPAISSHNVPRDSKNRPLILSPQHCAQVKHYQSMYGMNTRDVLSWVSRNCFTAKMFVPDATCEEIKILVASCYTAEELGAFAVSTIRTH